MLDIYLLAYEGDDFMISNKIYLIILIVFSIVLITELPSIVAGYLLSDFILALYVSYLIKTFFIHSLEATES